MIGVLASRADEASTAIARALLERTEGRGPPSTLDDRYDLDGVELRVVDALHLNLADVQSYFAGDPDWIAIASRHSGDTGALLTAHHPGNVAEAAYGGEAYALPPACPGALSATVDALDRHAPAGYEVGIECTHHGPTASTLPLLFVEVGSSEPQWRDPEAAAAVAEALWAVRDAPAAADRSVVGIGGGHYAPRYRRLLRETTWCVGHVLADWGLESLEVDRREAVVEAALQRSGAAYALVVGDHPWASSIVEALGYRAVDERWLRAADALSPAVVDRLEGDVQPLDDGLALGDGTAEDPATIEVVALPGDLLAEAAAIDPDATAACVAAASVAYATGDDGHPSGGVAIAPGRSASAVIDGLVSILGARYDALDRRDGHVVASRRAFHPELAHELGVPEGPLFGRLADGEAVEVDGETVPPTAVTRREARRFETVVRRSSDGPGER
ncbi:MAG: D-aminoacyl-tRNA deacylase [Halobacteriales archaeon]